MARKKDKELYTYHKGFRINNATKKIVSMMYHDPKTGKARKLSHLEKPTVKNTDKKTYYLPTFVVSTLDKDLLLKDEEFLKALEFKRRFNRENHAMYERAKKNYEWQNQWGEKEKELKKYEEWRKEKAPMNYSDEVSFLKRVIFRYFLTEKVCSNPLNWYQYHFEFKEWLKTLKKQVDPTNQATYSYNSLNNIIRALNAYYKFLEEVENQVVPKRCSTFDKRFTIEKGVESVVAEDHKKLIFDGLGKMTVCYRGQIKPHPKAKLYQKMYNTLINTGMRKNEVLGLSLQDVAVGKLRDDFGYITETLKMRGVNIYGHIYLQSQPKNKIIRSENGNVERRPLKLKRKISGNNSRYIPLLDKENARELGQLVLEQKKLFEKRVYGDNKSNYLLFDGISYDGLNYALKKVYEGKEFEDIHDYTVHDFRHTFSTYLSHLVLGQVSVVSKILGHSREEITMRYLHLHDQINTEKEISKSVEEIEEVDLDNLKAL